jgi:hypothetical protein
MSPGTFPTPLCLSLEWRSGTGDGRQAVRRFWGVGLAGLHVDSLEKRSHSHDCDAAEGAEREQVGVVQDLRWRCRGSHRLDCCHNVIRRFADHPNFVISNRRISTKSASDTPTAIAPSVASSMTRPGLPPNTKAET